MMTRGRAHPLTVEEPTITMTVAGTYWQDSQIAATMIDSSATHSFVSHYSFFCFSLLILPFLAHSFFCCSHIRVVSETDRPMVTEVTVNRMIYVTDVYQVTLLFLGIEFPADLISSFHFL